ncbi:hypothetical protein NE237_018366 [Protea cynaroides]|uniref:Uncharacterized protein n=1 Tax=Protea cynaroides TaxID=273540 RepID=A0A9Q0K9U6_9MAGN|nr:hypothetical protein NE237_018366 [Protea cynaroides]
MDCSDEMTEAPINCRFVMELVRGNGKSFIFQSVTLQDLVCEPNKGPSGPQDEEFAIYSDSSFCRDPVREGKRGCTVEVSDWWRESCGETFIKNFGGLGQQQTTTIGVLRKRNGQGKGLQRHWERRRRRSRNPVDCVEADTVAMV